jgi:hypothetical protein
MYCVPQRTVTLNGKSLFVPGNTMAKTYICWVAEIKNHYPKNNLDKMFFWYEYIHTTTVTVSKICLQLKVTINKFHKNHN